MGAAQGIAVCVAGCGMAAFPFVEAAASRLVLVALAFAGGGVAIPLHCMTAAEVVPAAQRGAVFGVVAAAGTLPGLVAPFLTCHLIDAGTTAEAGCRTAFLVASVVMILCGLIALARIRPEPDAGPPRRRRPGEAGGTLKSRTAGGARLALEYWQLTTGGRNGRPGRGRGA
ncbi:MFS transporter [Streptomyces luteolus]|uniref:Major facilitator superfamily (MFS) profile domain-containing protein n=1 Tax=Streptomyces luteolus TaxID=3043615 RepID=A0ABT6SSU8_9ACTN|nr:MFS transporter [Streptomyces sp. B-S-A12]MDI3418686.1 hypothetical protein [Streptomyces sp. B-S-A12]